MSITYTNRHGLPDALARAIINDEKHTAGQLSVTQLLAPPLIGWLLRQHDVEIDVSERLWAMLGKGIHAVIDRSAHHADSEQQLVARIDDVIVSGTIDSIEPLGATAGDGVLLRDWKTTSTFTGTEGREEWEQQLNSYAWLFRHAFARMSPDSAFGTGPRLLVRDPMHRHKVVALAATMIYRDWTRSQAERRSDYPPAAAHTVELPLWEDDYTADFLRSRLRLHLHAGADTVCTPEERWHRPDTWAVKKTGRKTALRVLPSADEARTWAEMNGSAGLYLEHRPGSDVRCESYCPARSVCPHGRAVAAAAAATSSSSNQNQNPDNNQETAK